MSTANPFATSDGVTFPGSLRECQQYREEIERHITRVTIEHSGLPQVCALLQDLEDWQLKLATKQAA